MSEVKFEFKPRKEKRARPGQFHPFRPVQAKRVPDKRGLPETGPLARAQRGIVTQVKTKTGDSLSRMLQYTRPMVAALEDGTSWVCTFCNTRNTGETNTCVICNHRNENL